MYPYSSPPPGWSAFDYTTSPPTSPHYVHYSTQFANMYGSPRASSKRHNRKASYSATTRDSGAWYSGYPQSYYEMRPEYGTPPRKHNHVSASFGGSKYKTSASRRHTVSGNRPWDCAGCEESRPSRSQKPPIFVDEVDDASDDDVEPPYVFREHKHGRSGSYVPPPSASAQRDGFYYQSQRHASQRMPRPPTDHYFHCNQVPTYEDIDSAKRSRTRRQSTSTRTPQKPRPSTASKSPTKATEEDAARAGIPPGYSIKNWDPTEAPIILLGSVFDANSLGKWIYDWTVFHHGASTPMADVAGELWLLLIKLAGKIKRADECLPRIKRRDARETVEDFLEGGERLWNRFKKLLKECEHYMWKAAKREGGRGPVSMGRNAGCEFVESIFGRDRQLETTEKLMNSIRVWSMRFDANCEEILRRPC
ncbi:hypothetical protein MPDQ_004057 [Monascus purpureus]|uniref:Vegetative cell wall protein gp1 n=1 Tax=Monascus purpureus TaxID=5098 RepID=A0A507QM82_MONPU|nr:hypothetical protein MPDQ_004057 [Monascus purpureus]